MQIVHTVEALRQALADRGRPAFVPTMGNLHDGHLSLARHARHHGDVTVASIFVNRLQFLPHEDFGSYPRTFEADCLKLQAQGCDVLFAPKEHDLYPQPQTFTVQPNPALADILEGHFRPGFFTGVSTVVMKLFSCVFGTASGGVGIFGKKDYQQLLVIRHMVQQFALPVQIVGVDTERAADGLALSSRNNYLSPEQRSQACALYVQLQWLATQVEKGQQPREQLEIQAMERLAAQGWQPDYLTVRQRENLLPPTPDAQPSSLVALGAARLAGTRLIDNLEF